MCDLKPMWATLFPELTERHRWIAYSDYDILYGRLADEVAALEENDEMLVPSSYFPQPLSNGNLVFIRTIPKMVNAFRRSPVWRDALRHDGYWVFDEWWGGAGDSMVEVYNDMWLHGEVQARSTRRHLLQASCSLDARALHPSRHETCITLNGFEGCLMALADGAG
eukprot:CAMPEP_0181257174 /NCGR_PEP_ID=MMETSP1096-20121128/50105_1 /TAXON_ID=156174 ORGANISM="Chrysochromulina ericina, Strain CCMP281" /NCGR_SAMPLE_ID=MMETSP1096 /ASSEMBLY_ACC=CAM_ASM_000453 /LENGTH=165 /DNA_ID=CAMNT_0023355477 /DNA_START=246 /DNA_END=743 /DNA_ORIENTATION=+